MSATNLLGPYVRKMRGMLRSIERDLQRHKDEASQDHLNVMKHDLTKTLGYCEFFIDPVGTDATSNGGSHA